MKPHFLTFFCELAPGPLGELFDTEGVLEDLREMRAGVSLGLVDLTGERAQVVRRLNREGIPVTAWLLLPPEQGYWFHAGNIVQARARYEAFRTWSAQHDLKWASVGLDIEPDIEELRRWARAPLRSLPGMLSRLILRGGRSRDAKAGYRALVERIRADGHKVDTYQFPFIVDERQARSSVLRRVAGMLDVPTDREVLMLYTSFVRPQGPALLWSYAPGSTSIAVGSTGGGVELPGLLASAPLDWTELSRDLRLAVRWTHDLHVFSLEGCVKQGFLPRLRDFNWDAPVEPPWVDSRRVDAVRRAARGVLGVSGRLLR
ncbi:hypothetical protein [Myxococcus faecalis]|uniref:hypothetical protein n=1 Tax=Myxococcus faecalis TaxID=3115646 RepID=UPI003CF3286B